MMLQLVQSPSPRVQRLIKEKCKNRRSNKLGESSSFLSSRADQPAVAISEPLNKPATTMSPHKEDDQEDKEEQESVAEESRQDELNSPISTSASSYASSSSSTQLNRPNFKRVSRVIDRGDGTLIASSAFSSSSPSQGDDGYDADDEDDDSDEYKSEHNNYDDC